MADVILKRGRDRSVRRRHPWVLSGSVAEVRGAPEPGDPVRVLSAEGEVLGHGHFSPASSLRVRLFGFGKDAPEDDWLARRIRAAVARREGHALLADTDAVRLVNAESDGLPGLVADRYADVVVVKLTSAGMVARRDAVAEALRDASGAGAGLERADAAACRREKLPTREGPLWGEPPRECVRIVERGRAYGVDVLHGQKTGFYLDQRDARDLVSKLSRDRSVLDLFCYTGGFALAAAMGGARSVTGIDSSADALERARAHLAEGAPRCAARFERADAFRALRAGDERFELLVVDPPPLCRHRADVARASRAYKDLLLHALRRAAPGGRVLGFTCSHHVGRDLLRKIAFGAALDAGRQARVVAELGAPADHPVSLDHPEGAYLHGLLLEV